MRTSDYLLATLKENPSDAELGEHSQEVLEMYLDLNEREIEELRAQGIIWS